MKIMKAFAYIMLIIAAFVSGNVAGYKAAITDSSASITYAEMVTAYDHLETVEKEGPDAAQQKLITNIAATIPRHKTHIIKQSFLSEHEGPNNEVMMVTNRAETYAAIEALFNSLPDFKGKQVALDDLKELQ